MKEQKTTLQTLELQKRALKKDIALCEKRISRHWDLLFTPPQPNTKVEALVAHAERAYAVYDGVMLGYKLLRRFNRIMGMVRGKKKSRK